MVIEKKLLVIDDYILARDLAETHPTFFRTYDRICEDAPVELFMSSSCEIQGERFILNGEIHNGELKHVTLLLEGRQDKNFKLYVNNSRLSSSHWPFGGMFIYDEKYPNMIKVNTNLNFESVIYSIAAEGYISNFECSPLSTVFIPI